MTNIELKDLMSIIPNHNFVEIHKGYEILIMLLERRSTSYNGHKNKSILYTREHQALLENNIDIHSKVINYTNSGTRHIIELEVDND